MVLIEVLPNSSAISAPGWAYVPDTGYDPSKAPIQPSGARKRNARVANFGGTAGGGLSSKQNNILLKRLAELDKDNFKDVQISLPGKGSSGSKASKGKTTATRKILLAQKTFANYLADDEALAPPPRPSAHSLPRVSHATAPEPSSSSSIPTPPIATSPITQSKLQQPQSPFPIYPPPSVEDAKLLESAVPLHPSAALLEALVSGPALSYNAARAEAPSGPGRPPPRQFCELCGYWGRIKCIQCGARVCGLDCKRTHDGERCLKYPG